VSSLPTALDFRIPSGSLVPTRVLEERRDGAAVLIEIEVGQEEWETIDLVMLFNLRWDRRNPGEISGDTAVRILLQLDPALVASVDGADIVDTLAALPEDDDLRSTTSWYGLEVTEEVALPPALAAKGEVRQGFTTTWRDELAARSG
jgi:hypothetical protein